MHRYIAGNTFEAALACAAHVGSKNTDFNFAVEDNVQPVVANTEMRQLAEHLRCQE